MCGVLGEGEGGSKDTDILTEKKTNNQNHKWNIQENITLLCFTGQNADKKVLSLDFHRLDFHR